MLYILQGCEFAGDVRLFPQACILLVVFSNSWMFTCSCTLTDIVKCLQAFGGGVWAVLHLLACQAFSFARLLSNMQQANIHESGSQRVSVSQHMNHWRGVSERGEDVLHAWNDRSLHSSILSLGYLQRFSVLACLGICQHIL